MSPRYTLMVSGPNGQGRCRSWPDAVAVPWADAKSAYERQTRIAALYGDSGCPLTYAVVSA